MTEPTNNKTNGEILSALDEQEAQILGGVIESGSCPSMGALAAELKVHPKTKSLLTAIGKLRSRGLLTKGWPIKPTDVFPQVGAR